MFGLFQSPPFFLIIIPKSLVLLPVYEADIVPSEGIFVSFENQRVNASISFKLSVSVTPALICSSLLISVPVYVREEHPLSVVFVPISGIQVHAGAPGTHGSGGSGM